MGMGDNIVAFWSFLHFAFCYRMFSAGRSSVLNMLKISEPRRLLLLREVAFLIGCWEQHAYNQVYRQMKVGKGKYAVHNLADSS